MRSRHRVLIIFIGLAAAMLAGCTTTSAPAQDVSWLAGRWQGELTASGALARIGVTNGPVTMILRQEGGGSVGGEIIGLGGRPCTLRGRGDDTGYTGNAAISGLTAGQNIPSMPFEFKRRGPDTLEGTIGSSQLRFKRE